jgi:hypothetical protein
LLYHTGKHIPYYIIPLSGVDIVRNSSNQLVIEHLGRTNDNRFPDTIADSIGDVILALCIGFEFHENIERLLLFLSSE